MNSAPVQEQQIISALFYDELFLKKALPHLKDEYFQSDGAREVLKLVKSFVNKYNSSPTVDAIGIDLQHVNGLSQQQFKETTELLSSIEKPNVGHDWLVDMTEKYCQDRAVYLGIMKSIQILDESDSAKLGLARGAIPTILSEALATCFDRSIGHAYMDNADARWEFYHNTEIKIPFDLEMMNRITRGGISRKTLTVIIAGTGVGKTLFMCHMAAHNFLSGLNVLYITMEMSEERIAQRIDANLLDIDINDLETTDRHEFDLRLDRIRQKSPGRLVIKEFGTGAGNVSHFRHLLTELSLKKHFKPDIIYVDYLNICASARYTSRDANSYMIVKAIAEELRGLAVEYDVPVVSATQFNRTGAGSSDPGMTDTSDSFGTPMTADLQFAIMQPEELAEEGKIVVKQLKNRYAPLEDHRRFYLGVDKSRMRVMNCDDAFSNDNPTRTGAPSPAASGHIGTGKPSAKVDSSGFDFSDDGEDE